MVTVELEMQILLVGTQTISIVGLWQLLVSEPVLEMHLVSAGRLAGTALESVEWRNPLTRIYVTSVFSSLDNIEALVFMAFQG